eukprot:PhM_4_TR1336/c2_g1_i1/m.48740
MVHMVALIVSLPLVTFAFRRTVPTSCWRQTLCALLLLFVQMTSRQYLQSIACVNSVNAYHPNVMCISEEAHMVTKVYLIAFISSVVCVVAVAVYVVKSSGARRYPWPVFFGSFRWHGVLTRWWIVVLTLRRVIYVFAYVTTAATTPTLAVSIMSAVAIVYSVAQNHVAPYAHNMDNISDMASQLGILLILQFIESRGVVFGCAVFIALVVPLVLAMRQVVRKMFNVYKNVVSLMVRAIGERGSSTGGDDNNDLISDDGGSACELRSCRDT